MNVGDGSCGLWKTDDRAPFTDRLWKTDCSDACVPHHDGCAASSANSERLEILEWYALHSIHEEEDFKDVFNALHLATLMRGQLLAS